MKSIKPIKIKPSNRIQAVTPIPKAINQIGPPNKQISRSPQPFEFQNFSYNQNSTDYIYQSNNQNSDGIKNLLEGIQLLNISQLREILRDYSLPNGGNKNTLINRLVMFLETFGQIQQNIIQQFSIRLKKLLLSVDNNEISLNKNSEVGMDIIHEDIDIPENILKKIIAPPSCLYENTDNPNVMDPFVIKSRLSKSVLFDIPTITDNITPVLQFVPLYPNQHIDNISIQLKESFFCLNNPIFWLDLKDFVGKKCNLEVVNINPNVPVVACVRLFKQLNAQQISQIILTKEPAPIISSQPAKGVCPLTRKIIIKPIRGVQCYHSQCFDLSGFVCHCLKKKQWQCPICKKILTPEDLRIDVHFFANASLTE